MRGRIDTAVIAAGQFAEALSSDSGSAWAAWSTALLPGRVHGTANDARWETRFVTASRDGRIVGAMGVHSSRGTRFPSAISDPARVAPELFDTEVTDARAYLLIGGHADMVAGTAVCADLGVEAREAVRAAVAEQAWKHARDRGLIGAALYVSNRELGPMVAGVGTPYRTGVVGEAAELDVPWTTWDDYLASLGHRKRSVVRRDLAAINGIGLVTTQVRPHDIATEAAPLVVEVKRRHGGVDHPRLAEFRLRSWPDASTGECVAFAVRDDAGKLVAASFGCHHGDLLDMHEIGLDGVAADRHQAYVQALVYAPLRYAMRNGCSRLRLGQDSPTPKTLRGAALSPVWAVAAAPGPRPMTDQERVLDEA